MFCTHCGAILEPEYQHCAACGKAVPAPAQATVSAAALARPSNTAKHLDILGILWMVRGGLRVLGALFGWLFAATFLPWIARQIHIPNFPLDGFWDGFLPGMIAIGAWINAAIGFASIVVGYGLRQREDWARTFALVMSFLALLSVPFGTALGVYTLIVLLPAQSEAEYRRLARAH